MYIEVIKIFEILKRMMKCIYIYMINIEDTLIYKDLIYKDYSNFIKYY